MFSAYSIKYHMHQYLIINFWTVIFMDYAEKISEAIPHSG